MNQQLSLEMKILALVQWCTVGACHCAALRINEPLLKKFIYILKKNEI